jgi:hypothetical protein
MKIPQLILLASTFVLSMIPLASAFSRHGITNNRYHLQHVFHSSSALSVFNNPFRRNTDTSSKEVDSPSIPDVVIRPDFRLAVYFLSSGAILDTIPYVQLTIGPLVSLLGLLFLVQTWRVRFVCDGTSFELKSGGDSLETSGENLIVGGENRWTYDSFVNWDFFPKGWIDQPQGPILVYFKENQTPSDKWNEGPGAKANSADAIAKGAQLGQVHFFPAICDAKQLREEFIKRKCAKLEK